MIEVKLQFKTLKQEQEFYQVDPRIQSIVLFVAFNMKKLWNHQAVVTSVKRDLDEQEDLIAKGVGVKNSPHLDWRAADIRLNDFPDKAHVGVLVDLINNTFPRNDGYKVAFAHGGKGPGDPNYHLHLQVPKVRRF